MPRSIAFGHKVANSKDHLAVKSARAAHDLIGVFAGQQRRIELGPLTESFQKRSAGRCRLICRFVPFAGNVGRCAKRRSENHRAICCAGRRCGKGRRSDDDAEPSQPQGCRQREHEFGVVRITGAAEVVINAVRSADMERQAIARDPKFAVIA